MRCRNLLQGTLAAVAVSVADAALEAADCNRNGVEDSLDIAPGDLGFQPLLVLETRAVAKAVLALDVDGDGRDDLAAAEASSRDEAGTVTVFRGPFVMAAPGEEHAAGKYLTALAAADLDSDGDLDLAAGSYFVEEITVLRNRGGGAFAPPVDFPAGGPPNALLAADLDGDGDEDLAAGLASGVAVHRNDGSGRLVPGEQELGGAAVAGLGAADLDGDGDVDLAATAAPAQGSGPAALAVLLNEGDARFRPGPQAVLEGQGAGVAAADLDGDSAADLVAAVPSPGHIAVLLNGGAGTFGAVVPHDGEAPMELEIADLDGDGDPDVAAVDQRRTRSGPGTATVFSNDGKGAFPGREGIAFEQPYVPADIAAGDLDGDALPDLAVSGNGRIGLFSNATVPPVSLDADRDGIPDECQPGFVRGDANADGKLDIADPIFTLLHLFAGGGAPLCEEAADADDSGRIELTDAVYLLAFLFTGGAVPPHPSLACGRDRTADGLACRAYPPCW